MMKNTILVDLVATFLLLVLVIGGGYAWLTWKQEQLNKEKSENQTVHVSQLKSLSSEKTMFEVSVKRTD